MQLVHTKSLVKFVVSDFTFAIIAGAPKPKACVITLHAINNIERNERYQIMPKQELVYSVPLSPANPIVKKNATI